MHAEADLPVAAACDPIIGMAQFINAWSLNVRSGGLRCHRWCAGAAPTDMPVYVWRPNEPGGPPTPTPAWRSRWASTPPRRGERDLAAEPVVVEVLAG